MKTGEKGQNGWIGKEFCICSHASQTAKHKNHLYLVLIEGRICTNDVQRTQGESGKKRYLLFLGLWTRGKMVSSVFLLVSLCQMDSWNTEFINNTEMKVFVPPSLYLQKCPRYTHCFCMAGNLSLESRSLPNPSEWRISSSAPPTIYCHT